MHDRPDRRYVLLSFDVEPVDGEEDVMGVLDVVYRHELNVTFFVTGEYTERYPGVVRMMAGQEVANHGYSHTAFVKLSREEKVSEIRQTRMLLENVTGKDVVGFRAPYNLVDKETFRVLEEEGVLYDASIIGGWGLFYPSLSGFSFGEIPVSSIFAVPFEDVSWVHYLRMPGLYFYLMKHKEGELESYLFHPHHIMQYKNEFEEFINYLKDSNVIFISHSQLIKWQDEGV
ncbi:polysaccharide deacetylase family protein [Nanoarchaeota archaeon]